MKQRPATVSLGDDYDDDNDVDDGKESDIEVTEADLAGTIVSTSLHLLRYLEQLFIYIICINY